MRDDTWSAYSQPHRFSGQTFLSPSPRQWLRARVRLISDDPAVFPTLRSLTFVANAPVITAGLTGRVFPREAVMDSLQAFRYTIAPLGFSSRDAGFDRALILLPPGSGRDAAFISASVGGAEVAATGLLRGGFALSGTAATAGPARFGRHRLFRAPVPQPYGLQRVRLQLDRRR